MDWRNRRYTDQTHRAGGSSADFWSAALTNATPNDVNLDFDFGSVVTVNTLALWNYNAFNSTAVDGELEISI